MFNTAFRAQFFGSVLLIGLFEGFRESGLSFPPVFITRRSGERAGATNLSDIDLRSLLGNKISSLF